MIVTLSKTSLIQSLWLEPSSLNKSLSSAVLGASLRSQMDFYHSCSLCEKCHLRVPALESAGSATEDQVK